MDFYFCKRKLEYIALTAVIILFSLLLAKMALSVSVLVIVVFLLSVNNEVISQCPPSSGKTLDVYSNNCIGFYRYLPEV